MYELCIYEISAPKCPANTDGAPSLKLRRTLKVTARAECRQGQAQGGNCSWIHPHGSSSAWLWGSHCLPFPAFGGCRRAVTHRKRGFISPASSAMDFTAFLLLVQDQTQSQLSLGAVVSSIEISQQQTMCCSWIFLRAELFAQNKAVINTINYLQEAGPVSQHLQRLPVFILVGKNPSRAGRLGFLTQGEAGFRDILFYFISPER